MKDEFTMAEYIAAHNLGVSVFNRHAVAVIQTHLQSQGYRKVRKRSGGKHQMVWTKDPPPDLTALKDRLKRIKK